MQLVDLTPLTEAVKVIGAELKRIRQILEPQSHSGAQGQTFRAGYDDPEGADGFGSSILQTSEFRDFMKEQMEKVYGRALTHEEEAEIDGTDPANPVPQDSPHTAARVVDGFSRGLDLEAIRAEEKG